MSNSFHITLHLVLLPISSPTGAGLPIGGAGEVPQLIAVQAEPVSCVAADHPWRTGMDAGRARLQRNRVGQDVILQNQSPYLASRYSSIDSGVVSGRIHSQMASLAEVMDSAERVKVMTNSALGSALNSLSMFIQP